MTRRSLTALALLACAASCSDGPPETVAHSTLPAGFLMAPESDEQVAPAPATTTTSTAGAASSTPATLPASLLVPSELEVGKSLTGATGAACDELTIEFRSWGCFNSAVNWFTFRPGTPITVLVEGHRSSGGRWTRDTLALDETDVAALSEMLSLFRESLDSRNIEQMGVSFELVWKLNSEIVATEQLTGGLSSFPAENPGPFMPVELIERCRNKR